jgi:hypothetical protein
MRSPAREQKKVYAPIRREISRILLENLWHERSDCKKFGCSGICGFCGSRVFWMAQGWKQRPISMPQMGNFYPNPGRQLARQTWT